MTELKSIVRTVSILLPPEVYKNEESTLYKVLHTELNKGNDTVSILIRECAATSIVLLGLDHLTPLLKVEIDRIVDTYSTTCTLGVRGVEYKRH